MPKEEVRGYVSVRGVSRVPPIIDIFWMNVIDIRWPRRISIYANRLTSIDILSRNLHHTHADIDIRTVLIDIRLRFPGRAPLLLPRLPLRRRPGVADLII